MSRRSAPTGQFKPGDKVSVWQTGGSWRNGVIIKFATYGGGYYYQYDPLPAREVDGIQPSTGGWTCDSFLKERENELQI